MLKNISRQQSYNENKRENKIFKFVEMSSLLLFDFFVCIFEEDISIRRPSLVEVASNARPGKAAAQTGDEDATERSGDCDEVPHPEIKLEYHI